LDLALQIFPDFPFHQKAGMWHVHVLLMETLLSICLGIGLSAACGFRVFVPFLVMSIAHLSGHLPLSSGFAWIGTYPALVMFSVATLVEVAGYYIPWLDHLLDTIATPAAIVAGTVISASVFTGASPLLKWSMAIIAGGGTAAIFQAGTVVTRAASTATTGGLANPVFATIELAGATVLSILTMLIPFLVALVVLLCVGIFGRKLWKKFSQRGTRGIITGNPIGPVSKGNYG
jgi:hypothetical protein